jgi:Fe-S-cluster containining protein
MAKRLPCIEKECSACCRQTTMPITATEASLLSRRTGLSESEFCFIDSEGVRRLLNNKKTKACVFLATNSDRVDAPGVCTVYEYRPTGCKSYPIVLDEDDSAILDELCPHRDEFDEPSVEDAHKLLILEEKLKQ